MAVHEDSSPVAVTALSMMVPEGACVSGGVEVMSSTTVSPGRAFVVSTDSPATLMVMLRTGWPSASADCCVGGTCTRPGSVRGKEDVENVCMSAYCSSRARHKQQQSSACKQCQGDGAIVCGHGLLFGWVGGSLSDSPLSLFSVE